MNEDQVRRYLEQDLDALVQDFADVVEGERAQLAEWTDYYVRMFERDGIDNALWLPPRWRERDWAVLTLWLRHHRAALFGRICTEWKYCEKRRDGAWNDQISAPAALADILATLAFGVPPALLATILVKLGLDRFCACDERHRCIGVTQVGKPCRRVVSGPDAFCWQHEEQAAW